jgi:hypothetical protein
MNYYHNVLSLLVVIPFTLIAASTVLVLALILSPIGIIIAGIDLGGLPGGVIILIGFISGIYVVMGTKKGFCEIVWPTNK